MSHHDLRGTSFFPDGSVGPRLGRGRGAGILTPRGLWVTTV